MEHPDLTPVRLSRLLASLVVSEALTVDLIRGRSIRRSDVRELRGAVSSIHGVLRALDQSRPWEPSPVSTDSESPPVSTDSEPPPVSTDSEPPPVSTDSELEQPDIDASGGVA